MEELDRERTLELEEKSAQSDRRNEELTFALERESEAKHRAEEAVADKSRFLGVIGHELRTPMNSVIGICDLLADTELSPAQRSFVSTIQRAGDTLVRICDDILELTKIEAGQIALSPKRFELRTVLEELLRLMEPAAIPRGLELVLSYDPNLADEFIGDIGRIRQIVTNLVNNGIKYTRRGGVRVAVAPSARLDYGIRISVEDTGPGISEDEQAAVFLPFSRLERTHGSTSGAGLGLTICRYLTDLMKGEIWAESELEKGTIFHVEIPLEPTPPGDESSAGIPDLGGCQIVLVGEADPLVRRFFEQLASSFNGVLAPGSDLEAAEGTGRRIVVDVGAATEPHPMADIVYRGQGDARPVADGSEGTRAVYLSRLFLESEFLRYANELLQREVVISHEVNSRLLIVEDNPVNRKVARLIMERAGFEVDIAEDGLVALEKAQESWYDVILMDVQMPRLDGIEATKRIRELHGSNRQPIIIAVTAGLAHADRGNCVEAGMDDYVTKPIRREVLMQALKNTMAKRGFVMPSELREWRPPAEAG